MSDEAIKYVIFAVILVVAILVTWFLAIAYRKNVAEAKQMCIRDRLITGYIV